MVPKEFRKPLCVIAGLVTLVEAVVWAAASIYSIKVYSCSWDFFNLEKGVSTWSMLYISYFMGECKGEAGAQSLGYNLSPPTESAKSLQVWFWIYTIVCVIWIPCCVLLIVVALSEIKGTQGAVLYYPWVAISSVLIALDLAGALYHVMDIYTTTTPDDYAKFNGAANWNNLTANAQSANVTTWLPSLYVSLFFCRLLVIWLLNIYLVQSVYKANKVVGLYKTKNIQSLPMQKRQTEQEPSKESTTTQANKTEQTQAGRGSQQPRGEPGRHKQELSSTKYKTDEFGIPIGELNDTEQRQVFYKQIGENFARASYEYQATGRVYDFTGRPLRPGSYIDRGQDGAPPMASGVQVPPELNKFEPFSYIRGDQPQLIRKPVSRSNSKTEYPPIPRPDYTIANRRSAPLEYVPNRFKVPSPKRPVQSQNSFNYDPSRSSPRSPGSPKVAPIPPRKPQLHTKSAATIPEDPATPPQARYIQASQTNNYNINKLY